jgi:hypothetical protein
MLDPIQSKGQGTVSIGRISKRMLASAVLFGKLLTAALSPAAHADARDFQFQNRSNEVVVSLHLQPIDGFWGSDVLGNGYVRPGRYVNVHFDPRYGDTCYYNIEVVTLSGRVDELYAVDLCTTYVVTYP